MLRSRFVPAALFAALFALPALGDDPKPPQTPADKAEQQQKEIIQKLRDLQADVAALKSRLDGADARKVEWLESIMTRNKLDEVLKEVQQLRVEMNAANKERSSGSSPVPDVGDPSRIRAPGVPERFEALRPALMGTVRLANNFVTLQQVQVNRALYALQPGQELDVSVPAGTFSLRVVGVDGRARTREVPAGKVYTFQID